MAYVYEINPNQKDSHQMQSWWFAVFVRFKQRDSFNHSFTKPGSVVQALNNPVEELDDLLIVDHDLISWQVSSSKPSHVSNASFTLMHSGTDYVAQIAPDDWCMFFVFNDKKKYLDVLARVKKKQPVNKFDDGLKFVGRVDAPRRTKSRDPRRGTLNIGYQITANGFVEFDSIIYYNDAIAKPYPNVFMFLPDFGVAINEFILDGHVNPQTAIPKLLGICLGIGPGQATTSGFSPEAVNSPDVSPDLQSEFSTGGLLASPNRAYRIPTTIAQLLGRTDSVRPVGYTYNDILNQVVGIQKYDNTGFMPVVSNAGPHTFFGEPLDGESLPYPIDFNKKTVWAILGTYLNAPINEMYTCLRYGPDGIMPTYVVRQLPLSSQNFLASGFNGTAFVDLPRWKISSDMIYSLDTGRSNAARFNYVFLQGLQNLGGSEINNMALGYQRNPPIIDEADVMRSGLRMYDMQVSGTIIETAYTGETSPGRRWSHMMADILMGGHLKYSGSVNLNGVIEPICEGDNAEIDGVIYHIERVAHSGGIDGYGARSFNTSLMLTNGIATASENLGVQVYPDFTVVENSSPLGTNVLDAGFDFEHITKDSE